MVEIDGVVNDVPVAKTEPPVGFAYQFKIPALAVAPKTSVPASHLEFGAVLFTVGVLLIVAITLVLDEVHPPLVTST